MSQQLVCVCHTTKEEAQHFERPFGGLFARPETNQQARNDRHVDLNLDAVRTIAQQVLATKNAFEPAKKQFHGPSVLVC